MDPRIKNGRDIINKIKNREYYRPFGASILSEFKKEYFNLDFENSSIWKSGTNTQLYISLFHPFIEYLYLDMTLYGCEK